jgi:hypothetical protein
MLSLTRHPDCRDAPALSVRAAEPTRTASGGLRLIFQVESDVSAVVWPRQTEEGRADGLWRNTCLEAFVGNDAEAGYFEFNLAPSGAWAAYRFSGYRDGMEEAPTPQPMIRSRAGEAALTLEAEIDLSGAPDLADAPWRVGLSAVIEDVAGGRSYWALRHPAGKPDFHHPDSFVLALPPVTS